MLITTIVIQNFRKLFKCHIDISRKNTIFVGANNSGKTSAMDALNKFLSSRSFSFNDITISNRTAINEIGEKWHIPECEQPFDLSEWDDIVPKMDIWFDVPDNEIYHVSAIIPTLKWQGGKLGVRLALFPKDLSKLFTDYRISYFNSRKVEKITDEANTGLSLFPKNLCDFLSEKLSSYFSLKAFILDPSSSINDDPQPTNFEMECFTDDPLNGIIKVDIIDAQRGFSDPDSSNGDTQGHRLSRQLSNYYKKHLDPERAPSVNDINILGAAEEAQKAFDNALAEKFEIAIKELNSLGYPGVTDPGIMIKSKVNTTELLEHNSDVQYSLDKNNTLRLPEKYNGLGYQNLISMVFDLMRFRDGWMKIGKASSSDSAVEPLHIAMVEEPEAHLHVQVQQVFIRKAYEVLTRGIGQETGFSTQLIISTHSSHIAKECDFADLRYFKRLSENSECNIATSKVLNLSDVFGEGNETDKFVARYLQTTHCDLFFADAAILIEGSAESILLPHFIRSKYKELNQRYISFLSINGRHSHRLKPLLEKLCLPTLVITDLDPAENNGHHKGAFPKRGENLISGNYAITNWLIEEKSLDALLDLDSSKKIIRFDTPYRFPIRIAYQTPVNIYLDETEYEAVPSTFEDSLIYTNFELFKQINQEDAGDTMKDIIDILNLSDTIDDICLKVYNFFHGKNTSTSKSEFALDVIYAVDPDKITVPQYIAEGLEWLQNYLRPEG